MQYIKGRHERVYSVCMKVRKPIDRLVLGDRVLLPERLCVCLPRNLLGSEDVLLEEAFAGCILPSIFGGPNNG